MSTAELGTPPDLAANMKRVIRTLMAREQISVTQMRAQLPMSTNTWLRRMANGEWSAPELVRIASLLDCEIGDLFADPETIGVGQKLKFLEGLPTDGPPEDPTPPRRGHLSSVR